MAEKCRKSLEGNEIKAFFIFTIILLYAISFMVSTPKEIIEGIIKIVISRDALITDYFELTCYGAAFFNAALVGTFILLSLITQKVNFTGFTIAAFYINIGYALWGKNIINILPIVIGTFLYAKKHKAEYRRYIYTALFGTCLAPIVTEMVYILPFSTEINILIAVFVGIFVGYVIHPLSIHTASMHMGYSLYNVGFSGGILAFVLVCILNSFGIKSEPVSIWKEGTPTVFIVGIFIYFIIALLYGLFINKGKPFELNKIMKHPGRAVADFVIMNGIGSTFVNMSITGMFCLSYILLIEGDISGPILGAILSAFGFSAFGVNIKNYAPILLGVYIFTIISEFSITDPTIQIAAIFAVGLAPIAGQFGIGAGVIAGILHTAIVMCTSEMYGGLNLYNNGFSCGWVAIVMIPIMESFIPYFKEKKGIGIFKSKKQKCGKEE